MLYCNPILLKTLKLQLVHLINGNVTTKPTGRVIFTRNHSTQSDACQLLIQISMLLIQIHRLTSEF